MRFVIVFFLLTSIVMTSQNLVTNPSFENYRKCPDSLVDYVDDLKNWRGYYHTFKPNTYLPKGNKIFELYPVPQFNLNCEDFSDTNYYGYQKPFKGNGYSGFMGYPEKDKTVLCGELKKTLVKDRVYKISFKVSLSEKSNIALKDFQVLLTGLEFVGSVSRHNYPAMYYYLKTPVTKVRKMISLVNNSFYENKENWVTISGYYTALGYENYLIVGNFKNSEQIKTKKVASTTNIDFSFYYIDDIIIEPLVSESEKEKLFQMNQKEFKTEKTYTFKNVLFDFDKAILLNQSIKELNQLSEHLKTHPELTIEIYGHTDNVGLKSRNKELSQQRAEAVSKYLIEKGLNKKRIKWFGFGAEQPVFKNDSDKNRALNRRVNFILIEL